MPEPEQNSPQSDEVIHANEIPGEEFVLTRDLSFKGEVPARYGDLAGDTFVIHARPETYMETPIPTGELSKWTRPYANYSPTPAMATDISLEISEQESKKLKERYTTRSFEGPLTFDSQERPRNPIGRTGVEGKGKLYYWGPNNAADPVIIHQSAEGTLEALLIQRADGSWAFPGGFVDKAEDSKGAAFRELCEEAIENGDFLQEHFMKESILIFEGYTADGRNTDNAWIETSVHVLKIGSNLKQQLSIKARDDATDVAWKEITPELLATLYSDHGRILGLLLK
jgi:ADP-ribose pyrophosphatase YjhB (NUDIX family)